MKSKKLLSLALAGVMTLALAAPAFADGEQNQTLSVTSSTQSATIDVVLPNNTQVIVNPYSVRAEVTGDYGEKQYLDSQIVAPDRRIINTSNVPLNFDAQFSATPSANNVKLATESLGATATELADVSTNSVFLTAEFISTTDASTRIPADKSGSTQTGGNKRWGGDVAPTGSWSTTIGTANVAPLIVATARGVKLSSALGSNTFELPALDQAQATKDQLQNYVWIHISGNAASNPNTAWTANDLVTVGLTFTFTPAAATADTAKTATLSTSDNIGASTQLIPGSNSVLPRSEVAVLAQKADGYTGTKGLYAISKDATTNVYTVKAQPSGRSGMTQYTYQDKTYDVSYGYVDANNANIFVAYVDDTLTGIPYSATETHATMPEKIPTGATSISATVKGAGTAAAGPSAALAVGDDELKITTNSLVANKNNAIVVDLQYTLSGAVVHKVYLVEVTGTDLYYTASYDHGAGNAAVNVATVTDAHATAPAQSLTDLTGDVVTGLTLAPDGSTPTKLNITIPANSTEITKNGVYITQGTINYNTNTAAQSKTFTLVITDTGTTGP